MKLKGIFQVDDTQEPDPVVLKGITFILAIIRGHSKLFLVSTLVTLVIPLSMEVYSESEKNFWNKFNMKSISALSIVNLLVAIAKTCFLFIKREEIYNIYMILQDEWNKRVLINKYFTDSKVMMKANHQGNLIIKLYTILTIFWVVVALIYILFSPLIFRNEQVDIVKATFGPDMNIKYQSVEYWLVCIISVFVALFVTFVYNGSECIFVCFCLFLSNLLISVGDKFKDVGRIKYENLKEIYFILKSQKKINEDNALNTTNDSEPLPGCSKGDVNKPEHDLNSYLEAMENDRKMAPQTSRNERVLPEKIASLQLKLCVERHNEVLDYVKQFNDVFSVMVFIQYVYSTIQICFLLYHITYNYGGNQMVYIFHIAVTSGNFFLITLMGQIFKNESSRIAMKAYDMPWYEYSTKLRKSVLLIITRSQKPIQLTGCGFYVASMEGFSKVLSAAYSYYTL